MDKYIGRMLDNRYEILEIIGTGGMAVVYRARCHRLNRFVAVKILKDEFLGDEDLRRRFHAESEAVAMLSHPNIVNIFDVSSKPNMEYFVMELIDGVTLKRYMQQRGVLSVKETLNFVNQILKALSHAHERNIIHRDIKPGNMMIMRDGTIKVMDFGIAALKSKRQTLSAGTFGTVHYISPEQARGETVDGRSDIYSVGVMMYEMLTGQLPYDGDTPISIALQHMNSTPTPPTDINPGIPVSLEAIVLKAMSAMLTNRYKSASAMLFDINEFRNNPNAVIRSAPRPNLSEEVPTRKLPDIERESRTEASTRDDQRRSHKRKEKKGFKLEGGGMLPILAALLITLVFVSGAIFLFFRVLQGTNQPVDEIDVPMLVNMDYEEAVKAYAGEIVIKITGERYSSTQPKNQIISQNPTSGMKIKKGGLVEVTVSLGTDEILMPDYTGEEYRSVRDEIYKLLKWKSVDAKYVPDDNVDSGKIISTDPKAGDAVKDGDELIIYVSLGKEKKEIPMPSLVGMTLEQAKRQISESNLVEGTITEQESDKEAGLVISHTPAKGETVLEGSTVDIVVSLGPPTVEQGTATMTFDLPNTGETGMRVIVKQDNDIVVDELHDLNGSSLSYTLTGEKGTTSLITVFINDVTAAPLTYTLKTFE